MKLAPSKNPEKESKQFGTIALVCGIASLLMWPAGIAALAAGVRGVILSKRVKSTKYLWFSVIGVTFGVVAIAYYYATKA